MIIKRTGWEKIVMSKRTLISTKTTNWFSFGKSWLVMRSHDNFTRKQLIMRTHRCQILLFAEETNSMHMVGLQRRAMLLVVPNQTDIGERRMGDWSVWVLQRIFTSSEMTTPHCVSAHRLKTRCKLGRKFWSIRTIAQTLSFTFLV